MFEVYHLLIVGEGKQLHGFEACLHCSSKFISLNNSYIVSCLYIVCCLFAWCALLNFELSLELKFILKFIFIIFLISSNMHLELQGHVMELKLQHIIVTLLIGGSDNEMLILYQF